MLCTHKEVLFFETAVMSETQVMFNCCQHQADSNTTNSSWEPSRSSWLLFFWLLDFARFKRNNAVPVVISLAGICGKGHQSADRRAQIGSSDKQWQKDQPEQGTVNNKGKQVTDNSDCAGHDCGGDAGQDQRTT